MSLVPKMDVAAGDDRGWAEQAQQGERDGRLAATGFPSQAEDLSGRNVEADAIDCPHRSLRRLVLDAEVVNLEQRLDDRSEGVRPVLGSPHAAWRTTGVARPALRKLRPDLRSASLASRWARRRGFVTSSTA